MILNYLIFKEDYFMVWLIILAIIVVILIWFIATYNKFVTLRAKVDEAFSSMDVFLKKRYDLIPNLVSTVKGYASHEKNTLKEVVEARGKALNGNVKQRAEAEGELSSALSRLLMLKESYPELKADSQFKELSGELTSIEGEIERSRRYYNSSARGLNEYARKIPSCFVASFMKIEQVEYFTVNEEERKNVKVEF